MAGEAIFIVNSVDDVRAADGVAQALAMVASSKPRLVLVDAESAAGLELARRLRADPERASTMIVGLGDGPGFRGAPIDRVAARPTDPVSMTALVRECLNQESATESAATTQGLLAADPSFAELQRTFLAGAIRDCRGILDDSDGVDKTAATRKVLHDWAGVGGMVGYAEVSRRAREIEHRLAAEGMSSGVRSDLAELAAFFAAAEEQWDAGSRLAPNLAQAIAGQRFALCGFPLAQSKKMKTALECANAYVRSFTGEPVFDRVLLATCDAVLCRLESGAQGPPQILAGSRKPILFLGTRDQMFRLSQLVRGRGQDFLVEPWKAEEVVLRSSLLLTRSEGNDTAAPGQAAKERISVVIADDDSTVTSLIRATLKNYGIDCRVASDGGTALELIQQQPPDVAVLDVNMPGRDGFEVLAAVRNDARTRGVHVILLTARKQEADIMRGFGLGADDYVVKPFSPMELVARLRRLVGARL